MSTQIRIPNLFGLFIVLMLCLSGYVQWWASLDGDKMLAMHITQQWLAGKRLYADLYELNPPLFYALYALPTLMAQWTGWFVGNLLFTFVAILFCAVCLLSQNLLKHHPRWNASLAIPHLLLLAGIFIIWPNPAHFADREHLFLLLVFPYLLRWMPSLRVATLPVSTRIAVACLAAIGFCIKPYCMVLFIVVQLLIFIRERSLAYAFALENLIVGLFFAAYVAAIVFLTPAYITDLLPVAMATYSANGIGIGQISFFAMSFLFGSITFADFRLRYTSPYRGDILYFIGLCGGFIAYIFLNNGWAYTFYPFDAMILYLTGWVWLEFRVLAQQNLEEGLSPKPFVFGARACSANIVFHMLFVLCMYFAAWTELHHAGPIAPQDRINNEMIQAINSTHSHSFGVMPATFGPWSILAQVTGAKQETRFSILWMIPKFLNSPEDFTRSHEWILKFVATAYAQDLTRNKPDLMFVDAGPEFYQTGKSINLIETFSRYPDFKEAWTHYNLLLSVDHCNDPDLRKAIHKPGCRYDTYQRNALPDLH